MKFRFTIAEDKFLIHKINKQFYILDQDFWYSLMSFIISILFFEIDTWIISCFEIDLPSVMPQLRLKIIALSIIFYIFV